MNGLTHNRRFMEMFLSQFAGQDVLYHPNPGNGGDSLIAQGTYEAFARAGISVRLIDLEADVSGRIVFLGGGGNLIPLYQDLAKAIKLFINAPPASSSCPIPAQPAQSHALHQIP